MSKTKPTASATVIPALTTTFTPSPSCFSKNVHETTPGSLCVSGAQTIDCKWTQLGPTSSISDCLPPGWNAYGTPYYSPGVCPSGYSINDCLSVKVINETIRETRGTCCPMWVNVSSHCAVDRPAKPVPIRCLVVTVARPRQLDQTYRSGNQPISVTRIPPRPNFKRPTRIPGPRSVK